MPITFNVNLDQTGSNSSLSGKTLTLNTANTFVLDNIVVNVGGVSAGSLNNEPASGVTYADGNSASTVIPSGGYLYINSGWFPNTKISLANLVPDIAQNDAGAGHIRQGYKAYDEDGTLLTGTIPDVTPAFTGGTLTITPTASVTVPVITHGYSSDSTFALATQVTGGVGGLYGVSTTQPSGTNGTNYLTIDCTQNVTNGKYTASASVTRADVQYNGAAIGYVNQASGSVAFSGVSATNSGSETNIVPTVTDNFTKLYIPIVNDETFNGGDVTATASHGTLTQPIYTRAMSTTKYGTSDATSTNLSNYGISATTVSGGTTNYFTFVPGGSYTRNASVTAYADASTTAVTHSHSAGAILAHNNVQVIAAKNATQSPDTITFSNGTDPLATSGAACYKIAIVSPKGTGGAVTLQSTSVSGLTVTAGDITVENTGTFTTTGASTYGVIKRNSGGTNVPSGTDGTNYLTLTSIGSSASASVSGTVSMTYNRAAVTALQAYKGAVSIDSGAQLLAASNNQTLTSNSVSATSSNTPSITSDIYYVPIVTPAASGGGFTSNATISMSSADDSGTANVNISVTPSTSFIARNGATDGSAITLSTYGLQTTAPEAGSGDWVKIDPDATGGKKKVSASKTVTRAAVTVSSNPGITNGTGTGLNSASQDLSGSYIVGTSIQGGTNYYIKVVSGATITGGDLTASSSVSPSVENHTSSSGSSNITVTPSTSFKQRTNGTDGTSTISTSTYGFTTSPANTGNYVIVDPGATSGYAKKVSWSKTATRDAVSVTVGKGITAGFTDNSIVSTSATYSGNTTIGTSIANGTNTYIKIVDDESFSGGDVTAQISSSSVTSQPSVTVSATLISPDGLTASNYGIDSISDDMGVTTDRFLIRAYSPSSTSGTVEVTATASSTDVKHSHSAGVIVAHSNVVVVSGGSDSDTDSVTVSATATQSNYRYTVRVGSATPSVLSHNVTNPTVTVSGEKSFKKQGVTQTFPSSGITHTQPSDYSSYTGGYIKISTPVEETASGTSDVTARVTRTKGVITTGTSDSSESSQDVDANIVQDGSYFGATYIKVYDGGYTLTTV